jgi:hypothetical protein
MRMHHYSQICSKVPNDFFGRDSSPMPGICGSQEISAHFRNVARVLACRTHAMGTCRKRMMDPRRELRRRIAVGYYQYLLVPQLSAKTEVAAKALQV